MTTLNDVALPIAEQNFRNDLRTYLGEELYDNQFALAPVNWLYQMFPGIRAHGPYSEIANNFLTTYLANPVRLEVISHDIKAYVDARTKTGMALARTRRVVPGNPGLDNMPFFDEIYTVTAALLTQDKITDPNSSFDFKQYSYLLTPVEEIFGDLQQFNGGGVLRVLPLH